MTSENFGTAHYPDDITGLNGGGDVVDNTSMNGVWDRFASLGLLNPTDVETPSLRNIGQLLGLDLAPTADLVPNLGEAVLSANESTCFGLGSLQSLGNAGDFLATGLDPFASATVAPVFPTGVNLIDDIVVDNTWAGFDVNAKQALDFGQSFNLESNSPLAPIDTHGVPANTSDGRLTCLCGETFARSDSRRRHIQAARKRHTQVIHGAGGAPGPAGRFPCMICDRHRGAASFVRCDHLRQHLRVYHKMNKEGIDMYFRTYP